MAWFRRISLFLLVNFLVTITILAILKLLGVGPYMNRYGIDYKNLAIYSLIWGMLGSLISLALSRMIAKWSLGVKVIDPQARDSHLQGLLETVHVIARSAGLSVMPEVGIYESPEVNAFATGPTQSRALVAVSSGLLRRMSQEELEGVVGHEIAHIVNGDMVTMTLLQGIVNAFVIFLSRAIAFAIAQMARGSNDRDDRNAVRPSFFIQFALEIVLMALGSMIVAWYSRYREFRADQGGARHAGKRNMIKALQALKRTVNIEDPQTSHSIAAFKISSKADGFFALFSTHPPLDDRIQRLQELS